MKLLYFLTALVFFSHVSAEEISPFNIADVTVAPGQRVDFNLAVTAGKSDPKTHIPVSVIHGKQSGPVLAVVAGVHGFEFSPILAAAKLADRLEADSLSGTLILVRAAHVAAFENRSPYVNPYDRKNLNRSFPGDPKGTQTERIAWAISHNIVAKADFLIDVHSGDGAEWLAAFVGVYGGPLASDYPTALAVAEAFGFPNIVRYKMNTQKQIDDGRSLNRQGVAAKIPTILVEIGENGSRNPEHIEAINTGLVNTLKTLDMLPGSAENASLKDAKYFDGTSSVPVKHSGIWYPKYSIGRFVKKNEILGTLKDYHGATLETVKAPTSGFALYGLAGPPVKAGESVMTIAKPVPRFSQ